MKKLKEWSLLMLMMLIVPMMIACDGDEDGAKDEELVTQAIGIWMCVDSKDSAQGQMYTGLMVGKQVKINADGSYTSTASAFGYSGIYTVKSNTITAKSKNGDTFVVTANIKGDKMTWDGVASNGTKFYYVFIRE